MNLFGDEVNDILDIIEAEAMSADRCAEQACIRSKYSVQDYWICIEARMASLFNRVAKQRGVARRCARGRFSERLNVFKRETAMLSGHALPSIPEAMEAGNA